MSLLTLGAGPGGFSSASYTFYSKRVFDLFPQMPTAQSGFNTHTGTASDIFGSWLASSASNVSDYVEWTVYLAAGSYKLSLLHAKSGTCAIVDLKIDGGAAVDSLDTYNATTLRNQTWTSASFTVTEGSHTIRLQKNGKNTSATSYSLLFQQAQLVKQNAGSSLASVASIPHVIDVPVVFIDSHTNFNTISTITSYMFGTRINSSGAVNDTVTFSFWAPKGNFTLAFLYQTGSDKGIFSVSVDGGSIGTVDAYNAGGGANNLSTSLTGTLATTGLHTITFTMATKNGSSSSYLGHIQHIQIRMTSITEPLTQDLAPEVALLWPWMASAENGSTLEVSSANAYYASRYTNGSGSYLEWGNVVLRPGTYQVDALTVTYASGASQAVKVDTVEVASFDLNAGGTTRNVVKTATGIVLASFDPHTMRWQWKATSGGNIGYLGLLRFKRTGA